MGFLIRLYLIAAAAALVFAYFRYAPDNYDITAPVNIAERPTVVTMLKLGGISDKECFAAIARAGIQFTRLPDEVFGTGCHFDGAATLDQSLISWGGGVTLACPMLARLLLWERHALIPAAATHLKSPVARIEHFGTYSCRNIGNAATEPRSEHASANAIDIGAFRLEDGRRISVLDHYGKDGPEAAFLDEIFDEGCFLFQAALGPNYNASHRNHFHFDNGPFKMCR